MMELVERNAKHKMSHFVLMIFACSVNKQILLELGMTEARMPFCG